MNPFELLQEISLVHFVCYWIALLVIDFGLINSFAIKKCYGSKIISFNYWLPLGVLIPVLWLLSLPIPRVVDILLASLMILFFGVVRPYLYGKRLLGLW